MLILKYFIVIIGYWFQIKEWTFFRELTGRNIKLLNNAKTAVRTESYNQGVVIVSKPLERDCLFQVCTLKPHETRSGRGKNFRNFIGNFGKIFKKFSERFEGNFGKKF